MERLAKAVYSTSLKKAVIVNAISKYSTVVFSLLFNVILARILTPEDYGVVVVITVFVTFFNVLADMGIGTAVIQNKNLTNIDINCIFSFTVVLSAVLGVIFCLLSLVIALFYRNSIYFPIGCILSISLMFNALNMVPQALLMKEKKFINVGIRTVFSNVISGITGVFFAFLGFKYYALVFQSVSASVINFGWNYIFVRPKIGKINKDSINKIKSFSLFQFAFSVVNYFTRNMDTILAGKFLGNEKVGTYDKAYKLMLYPINYLSNVITPVLHPIFSDYQDNKNRLYEQYVPLLKLLSIIGVYITGICFSCPKEIITILYGENWVGVVPCFKLMSLSLWAQMLLATTGGIFQSSGSTKMLFVTGIATSGITVLGIIEGIYEGSIESVARNVMIAYNIQLPFTFYILIRKTLNCSYKNFFEKFLPDLMILSLIIAIGVYLNKSGYLFTQKGIYCSLVIKLGIVSAIYFVLIFLFKQNRYIRTFKRGK